MKDSTRKAGLAEGLDAAIARDYAAELAALASPAEPPAELVARAFVARAASAPSGKPDAAATRRFGDGVARAEPLGIALALAASLALGLSLPWTARRPSPLAADIASAWEGRLASDLRNGFLAPLIHDLSSRKTANGTDPQAPKP